MLLTDGELIMVIFSRPYGADYVAALLFSQGRWGIPADGIAVVYQTDHLVGGSLGVNTMNNGS